MKAQWRVCSVLVAWLGVASTANAQSLSRRVELGAQLSVLSLADVDGTNAGVGGRMSYDLLPWLMIDGQLEYFSNDRFELDSSGGIAPGFRLAYSRRRLEGFVGPKVGIRRERFGVFAKARPGFARLSDRGVECAGDVCAVILLARPVYRTEFAMDLGGVLEFYPSPRTVARFDLGTTLIRHRSDVPPCKDCTSSNLSSSFGFGYRF